MGHHFFLDRADIARRRSHVQSSGVLRTLHRVVASDVARRMLKASRPGQTEAKAGCALCVLASRGKAKTAESRVEMSAARPSSVALRLDSTRLAWAPRTHSLSQRDSLRSASAWHDSAPFVVDREF